MAVDQRRSDRGFTLLEVLVAFIIAALALGVLFNGATASLTEAGVVGRYEEALSRAQSHLAAASHGTPTSLVSGEGEEGHGFHWAVRIAPIANAPPRPPDPASGTGAGADRPLFHPGDGELEGPGRSAPGAARRPPHRDCAAMTASRQSGFTLLEVLISLMIFGILMTGLVQGTQFGLRAWSAQTRAVETHQDLDLVDRTMRRLISTMDPDSRFGVETFTGNQHSMGFTAAMPEALSGFGTREADIVVSVSPAHVLTLRWAPHYRDPHRAAAGTACDGAANRRRSYRAGLRHGGRIAGSVGDDWQAQGLPGLIRMRVVFPHGDPRVWPPIVASVDTY